LPGRTGRGHPRWPSLVELSSASGSLPERRGSEAIGFLRRRLALGTLASAALPGFPVAFRAAQRDPGSDPLLRFDSPSGLSPEGACPHLAMRAPLLGFSCRSAHPFRRSPRTPRGSTLRVKVRVQGLSPSSRFAPPSALRVYFTPQTPFGFSLQGFPLPRSRANSSLASCRRVVAPSVAHPSPRTMGPPAHLRPSLGMERVPLADFTALLPLRVRAPDQRG